MPGNILDPDVPVVLIVNLFSPLASAIYEQNQDREEGTEPKEIPSISTQIDGKNWWENFSLQSSERETEKEIPFQILSKPSQVSQSLGEGGVSSCRIVIQPRILLEKTVLSVLIARDEEIIHSEKVEIQFKTGTLTPVQKLEAWIPYYLALEKTDEALLKTDALIKLSPQASSPYSYMAEVLEATGDLEGAKKNVLKAIELFGDQSADEDPPFLYLEQLRRIQEKIAAKKKV
jgi:tetratricopeptide (TPR) repeat protein